MSAGLRSAWWPILALVWPAVAGAQALPPTRVTIPKVLVAPTLDDYLPGGAMPGLKVTDFRQREPKDLETPTQPTAGYLSYDASNVYVAFVCTQPRGDIRARIDGYDTAAIDPARRQLTPDGAQRSTGRQLFVKSSWLFRF